MIVTQRKALTLLSVKTVSNKIQVDNTCSILNSFKYKSFYNNIEGLVHDK